MCGGMMRQINHPDPAPRARWARKRVIRLRLRLRRDKRALEFQCDEVGRLVAGFERTRAERAVNANAPVPAVERDDEGETVELQLGGA